MKLVYGEKRENIKTSLREIFLINKVSKEYERRKTQNEKKNENIPDPQAAGKKKKNRSTKDYVIILKSVIRKQRRENKKTYFM